MEIPAVPEEQLPIVIGPTNPYEGGKDIDPGEDDDWGGDEKSGVIITPDVRNSVDKYLAEHIPGAEYRSHFSLRDLSIEAAAAPHTGCLSMSCIREIASDFVVYIQQRALEVALSKGHYVSICAGDSGRAASAMGRNDIGTHFDTRLVIGEDVVLDDGLVTILERYPEQRSGSVCRECEAKFYGAR
ncbi:hypothetical protein KY362_05715 [Candidatus Woesearchaeota archaeon]|nr:hypothetical protein [Candidatus Woesearchaeota archaeon]